MDLIVHRDRIMKGFVFAPMAPAAIYAVVVSTMSLLGQSLDFLKWTKLSLVWFGISLPFSYLITLILGIPLFWILKKRGLTAFRPSVIASTLLGMLVSLPIAFGLGWAGPEHRIIVIVASSVFAALAASTFWWIAYRDTLSGRSADPASPTQDT